MSQSGDSTESKDTGAAALCHLAALAMYVGVPFGNILGPLVVWLLVRSRSPFADDQGKEALNFQISFTVYGFLVTLLGIVLFVGLWRGDGFPVAISGVGLLVVLGMALAVVQLVFVLVAAVRASNGSWYRYPLTMRLVR